MTTIQNVNQSRWGFHSCNRETFLKLKKLQNFYWKALRKQAEWNRWNRKEPQNRLLRKWFRNEKNQKTGFEIIGPKPEPKVYPVFKKWKNYYLPDGSHALDDMGVLADYTNARTPRKTLEEVKPLKFSIEKIDKMISELEAFENS